MGLIVGVSTEFYAAIMGNVGFELLRSYRRDILKAAARYGVTNVRVFGSIARGDDHENSDVDFLVDVDLAEPCSM